MPMDHVMIGDDANGSCDDRCRCVKMLGCEVILTLNKQGTPTHISATHYATSKPFRGQHCGNIS